MRVVNSLRSVDVVTCVQIIKTIIVTSAWVRIGPVRLQCTTIEVGVSSRRTEDISTVS